MILKYPYFLFKPYVIAILLATMFVMFALPEQSYAGVAINSTERGWYDQTGFHNPDNDNYIAGAEDGDTWHNFFVFNIPLISTGDPICGAILSLFNPETPSIGYQSPDSQEIYAVFDVNTLIASLIAGTGGVSAYDDLGGGTSYGSKVVSASDNGQFVDIVLNDNAINALNAAVGGQIAIGGALTTLGQTTDQEFIFGSTLTEDPSDGNTNLTLLYECGPSGPIVIIPTIGQWGMIVMSLMFAVFAVTTLRRRTEQ